MLLGNRQQANYAQVQVEANASVSSSFELICMLHDRLIVEIDSLSFHIDNKDYEAKSQSAQKAIDILAALDASLDLDNPNELITNIHKLYEHGIASIFAASKDLDTSGLPELKALMQELKEGWEGAMAVLDV
ncbi:flagellar export chaperone FliS [Vibrio sp. SS-MA-C1-2]|uniref:flagellar export chaperone FliS n=1 Tax=Vibrio sp. SS-MA-C1-2 TaxID=2908646 RepID=UPI001F437032|nr:flagellar export chaperone FliS [Vibrio sp. SS-MA-C1-2]UJF18035.1 flagellar export chaperone FliS [Vibrio sp. SS-MA-C1-2]